MDSNRTQDFVPLADVQKGMVVGKDGSAAMIIETSAVNFDLLSENEQMAIIGSFAGLLNSLSFSIQIVIRSKKLDISSYLEKLVIAEQKQDNPLLKKLMQNYRYFVSSVIRENEVLDKQFFLVISVSSLELGIMSKSHDETFLQKALTTLSPRRDHIIRQLGRIGLKASQLNDEKLIRLFYDWYNEPVFESMDKQKEEDEKASHIMDKITEDAKTPQPQSTPLPNAAVAAPPQVPASNANPQVTGAAPVQGVASAAAAAPAPQPAYPQPQQAQSLNQTPVLPAQGPAAQNPYPNVFPAQRINTQALGQVNRPANTPFVVEELHD